MSLRDWFKKNSINALHRYDFYIEQLERTRKITKEKDKKRIEELKNHLKKEDRQVRKLQRTRNIVLFFLIVAIFSTFLSLSFLKFFVQIASIAGTSALLIITSILNKLISLEFNDINLVSTEIIAIYSKY